MGYAMGSTDLETLKRSWNVLHEESLPCNDRKKASRAEPSSTKGWDRIYNRCIRWRRGSTFFHYKCLIGVNWHMDIIFRDRCLVEVYCNRGGNIFFPNKCLIGITWHMDIIFRDRCLVEVNWNRGSNIFFPYKCMIQINYRRNTIFFPDECLVIVNLDWCSTNSTGFRGTSFAFRTSLGLRSLSNFPNRNGFPSTREIFIGTWLFSPIKQA